MEFNNIILQDQINNKYGRGKLVAKYGLSDTDSRRYVNAAEYISTRFDNSERRVLAIGDLHEPFTLEGYLAFCIGIFNKYQCTDVVFMGDVIDNHYASFHDTDPDGHSGGHELQMAISNIALWHKAFPNAKVCLGNHDRIPDRKRLNSGISKKWNRSIDEVLETPGWEYALNFTIDGVFYVHGEVQQATTRMTDLGLSVVQGHQHSKSYIQNKGGKGSRRFAMQLGCGVDAKSYAMAYGKDGPSVQINCGVILNNGTLPIIEYMDLD